MLFRERFGDVDVYGAAYTINVSADGSVLNAGGDLLPRPSATRVTAPESGAQAWRQQFGKSILQLRAPTLEFRRRQGRR